MTPRNPLTPKLLRHVNLRSSKGRQVEAAASPVDIRLRSCRFDSNYFEYRTDSMQAAASSIT